VIERDRIKLKYDIAKEEIMALKPRVSVMTINLDESGKEEKTHAILSTLLGFGGAILIYFFIFFFGVQVMRGVIEEKTSRIIEVIVSSVKPFQLMLGKIVGIALVGLTQFLLWIILTFSIISVAQGFLPKEMQRQISQAEQMEEFIPDAPDQQKKDQNAKNILAELSYNLSLINFPLILFSFLFYFMGGYLLYGALFAAIGSAVDSEADTQQFMWPVTIPLVLAFVLAQSVISNPDGAMAFWLSVIPFTSPIIMMVRIPFGVSVNELLISMTVLIASFIFITWLAGKIYRTGILMYGKKPSYKEMWKWIRYRD
jgi:ABC-2 type transport system permease protein